MAETEKVAKKPTPKTALSLLASEEAPSTDQIFDALLDSDGLVITRTDVRRYVQSSGVKVGKNADLILAFGVNVPFIRTLHSAIKSKKTITIRDAVAIVEQEYGFKVPEKFVMMLTIGSR